VSGYHFRHPQKLFTEQVELLKIIGGGWNSLRPRRKSAARSPA